MRGVWRAAHASFCIAMAEIISSGRIWLARVTQDNETVAFAPEFRTTLEGDQDPINHIYADQTIKGPKTYCLTQSNRQTAPINESQRTSARLLHHV